MPQKVICEKSFSIKDNLRVHVTTIHENGPKWKCGPCDRQFNTKGALVSHFSYVHEKLKKAKFDPCDKLFPTKNQLKMHNASVHNNLEEKRECSECGNVYKSIRSLKSHLKNGHKLLFQET